MSRSAMASMATMSSGTTAATTSSSWTTTATAVSTRPAPATIAIGTAVATRACLWLRLHCIAVEVGFSVLFLEVPAALNGHSRSRSRRRFPAAHLGALFLQNGLTRKPDAIAFHRQHLHQHLIALFQFVANIFDAMFRDFADVQQAVSTGQYLDECAKIGEPRDFAQVGLPYFGGGGDIADHLQRLRGGSLVVGSDVHLSGIVYVDLYARLLDDAANHLASRPDEIANLVSRNLQRIEARCISGNLLPVSRDDFVHLVENEHPATLRLGQRFAHDLGSDTGNCDFHLQCGNACACA